MSATTLHLKVQKIEQTCVFELMWGQGQRLMAMLPYPKILMQFYKEWQQAYFHFYKTAQLPVISAPQNNESLRGHTVASGRLSVIDWQARLVEAETCLLQEFHYWLRSAELFELRSVIVQTDHRQLHSNRLLLLTCTPLELARLPWEAWEIGTDFTVATKVSIVRSPTKIRTGILPLYKQTRKQARILAILGDATGLDFQTDQIAVRSLKHIAEVQFVGWQPGQTSAQVKTQIQQAIADEQGWDILFFAGHSNETEMTGGELAITPEASIQLSEITRQLAVARDRGLQVAIFNSCNGINIAESLIDLGFGQVAVMRELIHNRVAQDFLIQFLRALAEYQDIHTALLTARQFLRLERNLTYPSAYLVPSLFCHPEAKFYRLPSINWKWLQQLMPTAYEVAVLTVCVSLSLTPLVQSFLLDQRVRIQAVYRDLTGQVPPATTPIITLVRIDEVSIRRDVRIGRPLPMNRAYLSDLVTQLTRQNAKIIGIDYLLDRRIGDEDKLNQAIKTAIKTNYAWFIFAAPYEGFEADHIFAAQESGIALPAWSLQGFMNTPSTQHLGLPYPNEDCRKSCSFSYLLAYTYIVNEDIPKHAPQVYLERTSDLRIELMDRIRQSSQSDRLASLQKLQLSSFSVWLYEKLGIIWLQPVLDFSIPPNQIYNQVAAWQLLNSDSNLPELSKQIVIIAAGGYHEAGGISKNHSDAFSVPAAITYWRNRPSKLNSMGMTSTQYLKNSPTYLPVLTGGELHVYSLYHLLNRRLVFPIPDLWMVGIGVLLSKGIKVLLKQKSLRKGEYLRKFVLTGLVIAASIYAIVSLQVYISGGLLLPIVLPLLIVWIYLLPSLRRRRSDSKNLGPESLYDSRDRY